MKKLHQYKNLFIVLAFILVFFTLPLILNFSLSQGNLITTNISNESWLGFWGTYLGGIFAIIIGFLAIRHSNRNSEKAINQQYILLKQQHKEKRLDEYNRCLINNLELLNAFDSIGATIAIDYEHPSLSKAEIIKKKSLIYSYDLQYRYVFEINSNTTKSDLETQYNNCWEESRSLLSRLLDLQLKFIGRISQQNIEVHIKANNQNILSTLQQLIKSSNSNDAIAKYQKQIIETHKELDLLEANIHTYKNDIDAMTIEINNLLDMLLVRTTELFESSILLMKEKESIFVNNLQ